MIETTVKKIIAELLDIDIKELTLDMHLSDELGADSLDHVEIIMAIEEEFGFEISDAEASMILSIRDIINYIQQR